MTECATVVKEDEDSPERSEPPELIVVGAAARLPVAVTTVTEVGLVVHSYAKLSKLSCDTQSALQASLLLFPLLV